MTNPLSSYVFALPHTATNDSVDLLLVKRHLVQTRVDGRTHRGVVPNWAGQWGLVAARPLVSQSMEQTVQGAVLAQLGIDLSDPASAERYRIVGAEPHTLLDDENRPVAILFLTFLPEGLAAFAADAANNLSGGRARDGVIDRLAIKPISLALPLIERCNPPTGGWGEYTTATGSAGSMRTQLRSKGPDFARQLTERTAMAPTGARLAVETLAACTTDRVSQPGVAPVDSTRLLELRILGARRIDGELWCQTYAPGQTVQIQALTHPASPPEEIPIQWQGGEPDALGRRDWRMLPLGHLSTQGAPFSIRAILGNDVREARIAVVPDLTGVEVSCAHGTEGIDAELHPDLRDAAWVRAVLSPATEEAFRYLKWYGGAVDPNHPLDRRLISIRDIAAAGKGMAVEVDLGLR